jgi:hypothetical protein
MKNLAEIQLKTDWGDADALLLHFMKWATTFKKMKKSLPFVFCCTKTGFERSLIPLRVEQFLQWQTAIIIWLLKKKIKQLS